MRGVTRSAGPKPGKDGPDLTHLASRRVAAATLPNSAAISAAGSVDPQRQARKPDAAVLRSAPDEALLDFPYLDRMRPSTPRRTRPGASGICRRRGAATLAAADLARSEGWHDPPGIRGFLTTVDHKRIGMRYLVTSLAFLLIAGVEGLVLRTQLATPGGGRSRPEVYNQLMTMHGTTMIFLFNTPVLAGFGNYPLPLQLGTRDMAYPRLNASYWIFLFSGLFIHSSFLVGRSPTAAGSRTSPLTGGVQSRRRHRLLGDRPGLPRHLDHDRRRQLPGHDLQAARRGHVDQPHAHLRVGSS